ncbi:conserved hypothetical protein, membrane [Candidatus Magnetomorum sp. HK-1]|nr:conserved hypothetical protein, membrane [Candidatus Magnetomorum sp. HK-1]
MDAGMLIPNTSPIQVDWSIFTVLLLLTFLLHLLTMNVMLGTGLIALVRHLKKDDITTDLSQNIASHLPFTIAFTINFGVAPFLFLQVLYGHLIYTSSILMAVYWLSVIGILILAYYSAYIYDFKYNELSEKRIFFIGFTVVSLLWIAFVFTNNMTLMLSPDKWSMYFEDRGGLWLNLTEKTLFPRFFHFVAASIAIGGLSIALYRQVQKIYRKNDKPEDKEVIAQWDEDIQTGLGWFVGATLIQMAIGVWYFMSLPDGVRGLFIGNNTFGTSIFVLVIPLIVIMLVCSVRNHVWMTAILMIPVSILMILMRHLVRSAYLDQYFRIQDLQVTGQYSPMVFFLIALIFGISAIAYMVRLVRLNPVQ